MMLKDDNPGQELRSFQYFTTPTIYPGPHDLLLGRGGETNSHSGNINFRALVQEYKQAYRSAPKGQKPEVSRKLVAHWRSLNPPGRFLAKQQGTEFWTDIGDDAARRRASKSLGEQGKRRSVADEDKGLLSNTGAPDMVVEPSRSLSSSPGERKRDREEISGDILGVSNPFADTREHSKPSTIYRPSFPGSSTTMTTERMEPVLTWSRTRKLQRSQLYSRSANPSKQSVLQVESDPSATSAYSSVFRTPAFAQYPSETVGSLQPDLQSSSPQHHDLQQQYVPPVQPQTSRQPSGTTTTSAPSLGNDGKGDWNVFGEELQLDQRQSHNDLRDSDAAILHIALVSIENLPTAADLVASNVFASSDSSLR